MAGKESPSGLKLRPFVTADLPRLQEIRREAFIPVFALFREILGPVVQRHSIADADAEQAELLADICSDASHATVLVAELDDLVVGFVSYTVKASKQFGEIGLNAVAPSYAGRGIRDRYVSGGPGADEGGGRQGR